MLHQKLEQAHLSARRQRRRIVIGFVVGAAGVALAFLLINAFEPAPSVDAPPPVIQNEAASTPPRTPAEASKQRDQFKDALAAFEADVQPNIQTDAFAAWNAIAQHAIMSSKDAAIGAFSTGAYEAALRTLNQAAAQATAEITARDAAFDAALNDARQFTAADDVDKARVAIAEALRLKPSNADAVSLGAKIERLPDVLDLIRQIAVARAENDLTGEAALLRQALEIDPARTRLAARLKTVQAAIREMHFNENIAAGLKNVTARNLARARQNLAAAAAIFQDRDELAILKNKVDALARALKLEALVRDAGAAADADDWPRAARLYAEAAAMQADSQAIQNGRAKADTINDVHAALRTHLAAPQRLSAANVLATAKTTLTRAQSYFGDSPSLAKDAAKLASSIEAYSTPVPVRVHSDGATNVSVRGVGQVGKIEQKVISLTPGRYTFEGARTGYRSKLVQVDIAPGETGVTVKVVCDEPL